MQSLTKTVFVRQSLNEGELSPHQSQKDKGYNDEQDDQQPKEYAQDDARQLVLSHEYLASALRGGAGCLNRGPLRCLHLCGRGRWADSRD